MLWLTSCVGCLREDMRERKRFACVPARRLPGLGVAQHCMPMTAPGGVTVNNPPGWSAGEHATASEPSAPHEGGMSGAKGARRSPCAGGLHLAAWVTAALLPPARGCAWRDPDPLLGGPQAATPNCARDRTAPARAASSSGDPPELRSRPHTERVRAQRPRSGGRARTTATGGPAASHARRWAGPRRGLYR